MGHRDDIREWMRIWKKEAQKAMFSMESYTDSEAMTKEAKRQADGMSMGCRCNRHEQMDYNYFSMESSENEEMTEDPKRQTDGISMGCRCNRHEQMDYNYFSMESSENEEMTEDPKRQTDGISMGCRRNRWIINK